MVIKRYCIPKTKSLEFDAHAGKSLCLFGRLYHMNVLVDNSWLALKCKVLFTVSSNCPKASNKKKGGKKQDLTLT